MVLIWLSSIHTFIGLAVWHGALCGRIKKPFLFEHCQGRRKPFSSRIAMLCGLSHASFTKTDLPDSSLTEEPPDNHQFSTKFQSGCQILWVVGLSRAAFNSSIRHTKSSSGHLCNVSNHVHPSEQDGGKLTRERRNKLDLSAPQVSV